MSTRRKQQSRGSDLGSDPIDLLTIRKRADNPRSRHVDLFKLYHNTSVRRSMTCVLCGARGPTWASKWKKTAAAMNWEAEHADMHRSRGYSAGIVER